MTTAPPAPCPVPSPTGQAPDVRPAHSLPQGERAGRAPMLYAPHWGPVVAVLGYTTLRHAPTFARVLVNDHGRPKVIETPTRRLQVIR